MSDAAYKKEEQTCLFCIPIQCGMKVMAILNIIQAVSSIIQGIIQLSVSPGNGVMYFVLSLLPLWVSWQWFQWLKEDTPETTESLVKWMRIQFFVNSALTILIGILVIAGAFPMKCEGMSQEECDRTFAENRHLVIAPVTIWIILSILITFYFYNVTRRYRDSFHSS